MDNATTTSGKVAKTMNPSRSITICVYCGSSTGNDPAHLQAARDLARLMAARGIKLVYGGGTVGLMGKVAKTLVSLSGPDSVHGIIPEALEATYGRTTIVKDMHTRKRMMAEEVMAGGPGSGFIALAGGYGTIEEILEVATWVQLGIHQRGVCLLNINGFWDGVLG
ncbi:decarboxylase family protein [Colletotrichum salicis]|uniref:Decarboxylase family protein n=1 Tax=Colletotrichum salicis TaxID=1209931 RepID=A0A135UIS7_9PEZI|nr:decarboxylase family protein [Colletotrichum salicis]